VAGGERKNLGLSKRGEHGGSRNVGRGKKVPLSKGGKGDCYRGRGGLGIEREERGGALLPTA